MKFKLLIVLLLILFLSCCKRETNRQPCKDETVRIIDLISEPESNFVNLSDIPSDVEYIPLETNKKSLIV